MRVPGSISRATALNRPSPIASQRTDPAKLALWLATPEPGKIKDLVTMRIRAVDALVLEPIAGVGAGQGAQRQHPRHEA